jgi:NIMA-interacting peptidyl-prolyl cis-trans isomerase 1
MASDDMAAEFAKLATAHSDCASYRNNGDLGEFGHGSPNQMQKPFQDATYNLQVNEMTQEPVKTDSGLHLILRTK